MMLVSWDKLPQDKIIRNFVLCKEVGESRLGARLRFRFRSG